MSKNCNIKVLYKEANGKKYSNFYVIVDGFSVCVEPKFLSKKQYKAFCYKVANVQEDN